MTIYIYRIDGRIEGLLSKRIRDDGIIILPIGKITVRKSKMSGHEETLSDIEEMAVQAYAKGSKQITARWDEKYYANFTK